MKGLGRNALGRISALTLAASFGSAVAVGPQVAAAEDGPDFVFRDEDGHLVVRFAGAAGGSLNADQMEEIVNLQLSTMVHDRMRADAVFEAEPVDTDWADSMTSRIERHVSETAPEFSAIEVECRSASCRLVLEHARIWSVSAHQALMATVQRAISKLIEADPASFEPVFLIAAHYQEPERPYMKVFVRRAAEQSRRGADQNRNQAGQQPAAGR